MKLEPSPSHDHLNRLGEVAALMHAEGVQLMATPSRGRLDIVGKLPEWAVDTLRQHYDHLVYWWRHSPCVIAVCDTCGEWKITGSRSETRCYRGQVNKRAKFKWGCQGTMKPLDIPWTKKRPNRKRVKIKEKP